MNAAALNSIVAAVAVFVGSLLADLLFGDGVQVDDVQQAFFVALIAGCVQLWIASQRKK